MLSHLSENSKHTLIKLYNSMNWKNVSVVRKLNFHVSKEEISEILGHVDYHQSMYSRQLVVFNSFLLIKSQNVRKNEDRNQSKTSQ